jgi:hypothetical protein
MRTKGWRRSKPTARDPPYMVDQSLTLFFFFSFFQKRLGHNCILTYLKHISCLTYFPSYLTENADGGRGAKYRRTVYVVKGVNYIFLKI